MNSHIKTQASKRGSGMKFRLEMIKGRLQFMYKTLNKWTLSLGVGYEIISLVLWAN